MDIALLKRKFFLVNVLDRRAKTHCSRDHSVAKAIRATDVDVALCNVRYQPTKGLCIESDLLARSDNFAVSPTVLLDQRDQLVAVHDVLGRRSPDDELDIDFSWEILKQCS